MVVPGYKQTDVGVIPADWDSPRLDALGEGNRPPIKAGPFGSSLTKAQYVPAGFKVYGQEQVIAGDPFFGDYFISPEKYRELESCAVHPGDILLSLVGTIGRLLEIPDGALPGVINPRLLRLSPDKKRVSPRFFKFLFESGSVQSRLERQAQGGTMGVLNARVLRPFQIALPPLAEQRVIAAALSDVDALLGGLDRLVAKKRDLKQAAAQQLLTGQTRLKGFGPTKSFVRFAYGSIPDDWTTMPLSAAGTMHGRIGWQGLKQREFTDNPNDPFLITGMNFKDGRIRWEDVYHIPMTRYNEAPQIQLRPGDVLMTKDGTIGKLLFVEEIPHPRLASLNSHLLVLRPTAGRFVPKFLFYQLGSPPFARHIDLHKSGTTFFGLTQTATGRYPVVLPSISEQAAIAQVLTDMDAEIETLEERRDKTRDLKQAMMQELLTGRTRLVQPEAALA